VDLTTQYLGLTLKNPLVPSASPLTKNLDSIRQLEDAGAAAVVLHSLFEEQITKESNELDHYLEYYTNSFAESQTFFPNQKSYNVGPDEYLEHIRKVKAAVKIPVIGSLNGVTTGGWIKYAKKIESAGADAIELNTYYLPTNPSMPSAKVESMVLDVLKTVNKVVDIPVSVKLSPFFSATAHMAQSLAKAGAQGLVLFNRFYQPDLDLVNLEVTPSLHLSTSNELLLPLRWVAILYGRVATDFAITSGVHTYEDVLKGLMAGAKVTMMASELLKNGAGRLQTIQAEMVRWMEEHEYESVTQMQGSMSQKNVADPAAFERANYIKVLQSWRPDASGKLL
jgi:dihydroorotate dehydrogenase (fumarate)